MLREGDHVQIEDDGLWHAGIVTHLDRSSLQISVMVIEGEREGHMLEHLAQDDPRVKPR